MRPLTDDETRLVFEKLKKYIGQNLGLKCKMDDRWDGGMILGPGNEPPAGPARRPRSGRHTGVAWGGAPIIDQGGC